MGYITPAMGYYPGMDRREILMPTVICNVNQSNEQIQSCNSTKSQHPISEVVLTRTLV